MVRRSGLAAWRCEQNMRHRSTHWLEEELSQTSKQLEIFRASERAAFKRHAVENMPETEAAYEGRREEADRLRNWRVRLVKERNRRILAEKGRAPDRIRGVEAPGTGRRGRLCIGLHPLLPERGFVVYDRELATVAWVRKGPIPARAAELLCRHGVLWEEELMSHGLSPVPEEEGGKSCL
jgi:hypothetical protein